MKYYTLKELAEILQVGMQAIRAQVLQGKLRAYKIGKYWRVSERDFEKYMKSRQTFDKQ